jgi:hypothetical protein
MFFDCRNNGFLYMESKKENKMKKIHKEVAFVDEKVLDEATYKLS